MKVVRYIPINDNGDLIDKTCLFAVSGKVYLFNRFGRAKYIVYGMPTFGSDVTPKRFEFKQIEYIFKHHPHIKDKTKW